MSLSIKPKCKAVHDSIRKVIERNATFSNAILSPPNIFKGKKLYFLNVLPKKLFSVVNLLERRTIMNFKSLDLIK